MKSLWKDDEAQRCDDDLAMRVYTSRLLGASEELVMHGGGNTSVKSTREDFFGEQHDVLYVKGSGWDLKTIEKEGFAPLLLNQTKRLAELESLTDDDMVAQLKLFCMDPSAPGPSVEAILHAILPFKFVDHTHTDAVVTLTNNPKGEKIMQELYPDCLILPYIMPGFILSKQVFDAIQGIDLNERKGIILLHHGVFTFDDDAKQSYETMIELVTRAEDYITRKGSTVHPKEESEIDLLELAEIRNVISKARGTAQLAQLNDSKKACGFASRDDVKTIATRGPITPDHVIRTKRTPVILKKNIEKNVSSYVDDYKTYFDTHTDGKLTMLDPAPRWGVWKHRGTLAFGSSVKECQIIHDITRHTLWAIQTGETLGGWQALPEKDIFDVEYWVLEQNKLKKAGQAKKHQGKIAIVTGAASGIGKATALALHAQGAVVVGLDIDTSIEKQFNQPDLKGIAVDITEMKKVKSAIERVVREFGGLDILVCNAGMFSTGQTIDKMDQDVWGKTLEVNLTATQLVMKYSIEYLKLGIDPTILIVGSRNVSAPGPGASAYSVSKAGLTQLARVAALELASDGVRVNVIHPDAVFDTGLWTKEALEKSAGRYNMSVDEYKKKNLLKREISSKQIGELLSTVASQTFINTTGAQISVDGGNDRVI